MPALPTDPKPHLEARPFLVAAMAVCLSVLLFVPLAYLVARSVPSPTLDPKSFASFAWDPRDFHPEPTERFCFLVALVFFPVAVPGLMLAVNRHLSTEILASFGRAASIPVWLYLAALLCGSEAIHLNSCYLQYSILGWAPFYRLAVLALAYLAWKFLKPPLPPGARWTLVGAPLLALGLISFLHPNDPYMEHTHINAVFYSLVQVFEGRVLLHDFYNQYGLYPYFLLPLYRLVGLNTEIFSLSMGLLLMASFASLYLVLGRVCRPHWVLIGFWACLNLNYLYLKQIMAVEVVLDFIDQYFQYWPIRLLFPSLMLLVLCRYFESGKKFYYLAGMLLFSAGCFWNLDSGVPAWGAWLLTLGYSEFLRHIPRSQSWRNAVHHLMVGLACLLLVTAVIEMGLFLACSQWVPLSGMIHIHKIFLGNGFYMLPMELPHSWALVGLLYFAGLARAFQALLSGEDELRPRIVFALSVLGAGLFSYFQGRSHDWVLLAASWPATLLAVIFVDELQVRRSGRGLSAAFFWVLTTLLLKLRAEFATGSQSRVPLR